MKNFALNFLMLVTSISLYGECLNTSENEINGKFYVSPGSVFVASDGIYVKLNDQFIAVKTISVDEHGVFAQDYLEKRITHCLRCQRTWNDKFDSPFCPHEPLRR